ncbi:TlpA family protein disulfide reductase [Metabacillus sp. KIGAM252]|uniref:TlpA family protein disulfide reductase n=1 Tax=Metabacillus flavus TaxID=2823519 RepID=A0ABS5LEJ4_9BACI|nr:TlpA disulfide reductase family protein [Metabacillus flavus]MBS2969112.1 TlpA family protein disulfide reductase [Metabacillus flavus]
MTKRIAAMSILAVLILFAVWQALWPKEPPVGLEEGNAAPEFTLPQLDGGNVQLSDYKGKKVILNFWATWCPPCKKEIPELKEISVEYDQEVVILAVNYTVSEANESSVKKFVKDQKMQFPVLMDPEADVLTQYKVFSYPTTYFLDEKGVIQKVQRNMVDYKTLKDFVQS